MGKWRPYLGREDGEESGLMRRGYVFFLFSKGGSDGLEKMIGKGGGTAPLKEMGLGLGFSLFCIFLVF